MAKEKKGKIAKQVKGSIETYYRNTVLLTVLMMLYSLVQIFSCVYGDVCKASKWILTFISITSFTMMMMALPIWFGYNRVQTFSRHDMEKLDQKGWLIKCYGFSTKLLPNFYRLTKVIHMFLILMWILVSMATCLPGNRCLCKDAAEDFSKCVAEIEGEEDTKKLMETIKKLIDKDNCSSPTEKGCKFVCGFGTTEEAQCDGLSGGTYLQTFAAAGITKPKQLLKFLHGATTAADGWSSNLSEAKTPTICDNESWFFGMINSCSFPGKKVMVWFDMGILIGFGVIHMVMVWWTKRRIAIAPYVYEPRDTRATVGAFWNYLRMMSP